MKEFFSDNSNTKRLLTIHGFAGVGKSALFKHTIHYLQDRNFFDGGCVYLNCRGLSDFDSLLSKLTSAIKTDRSGLFSALKTKGDTNCTDTDLAVNEDMDDYFFKSMLNVLGNQERQFLLVFDNVEDAIRHPHSAS